MLVDAFPNLEKNGFLRLLRKYFSSAFHIAVTAVLTLASSLLGWEMPVFYCYLAISLIVVFLGEDLTGAIPVVAFGYMCISYKNNPEKFPETSALFRPEIALQVGYCVGVIVLLLLVRIFYTFAFGGKQGSPRFWIGFLFLSVSYLLAGAFGKYYGWQTVVFGAINAVAIAFLYFVFRYGVDWKKRSAAYFFRVLAIAGALVLVQVVAMYFQKGVIVKGESGFVTDRTMLRTGWGHYNTVGCTLAMCACATLYFAATKKHGWLFTAFGAVQMAGVVLTQSRGSILFGTIAFVGSLIVVFVKAQKREKIASAIVVGICAAAVIVLGLCFLDELKLFFKSMLSYGADDNGRVELFKKAWQYFLAAPLFGSGWGGEEWVSKFDLFHYFMAHNTVMQLLGSLGVFGTLAYAFHRFQTLTVLFRRRKTEKTFYALSIAVLLLTCMMDCHLFSCVPPVLFYSIMLAFMEGADLRAGDDTRLIPKKKKQKITE